MNVTLRSIERGPVYRLVKLNGSDFVGRKDGMLKLYYNHTSAVRAAAQYESALGRPVRLDVAPVREAGVWVLRVD